MTFMIFSFFFLKTFQKSLPLIPFHNHQFLLLQIRKILSIVYLKLIINCITTKTRVPAARLSYTLWSYKPVIKHKSRIMSCCIIIDLRIWSPHCKLISYIEQIFIGGFGCSIAIFHCSFLNSINLMSEIYVRKKLLEIKLLK